MVKDKFKCLLCSLRTLVCVPLLVVLPAQLSLHLLARKTVLLLLSMDLFEGQRLSREGENRKGPVARGLNPDFF